MKRWLAVILAGTLACVDGGGPSGGPPSTLVGLVVSPPVQALSPVGSGGADAAPPFGSDVAYVSLSPGSVPTGLEATITNQTTGQVATTPIVDGGFDPVAIAADVGDTLVVEVRQTGSGTPLRVVEMVRARRPPVVVRTNPPAGEHDVPLNANVVIVLSTPVDSTTLTPGSVQLWRDTTPVAGTVRLKDATGLRIVFQPDTLLAGETFYDLLVTPAVRDVNGAGLASTLDLPFSTGVKTQAVAFTGVKVAGGYTCGLTAVGATYCWGINTEGELGTTSNADCGEPCSMIPVPVAGGVTFQSVSLGLYHTCAVTANGTPYCWGSTNFGQLGADTGTLTGCYATPYHSGCPYPVRVAGALVFTSISAGEWHSCGVTTGGAAYCWGRIDGGALGADSATLAANCQTAYVCLMPVPVSGGLSFASVSAGNFLSCGLTTTGATYCWGSNATGQLGIGTAAGPEQCINPGGPPYSCSRVPVAVTGGLAFATVTALNASACGLTTTGAAYCWGHNGGLLGTGVPFDSFSSTPVQTGGNLTFTSLSAGFQYACGITGTGAAFCWGIGDNGVLGSGTIIHLSATPVEVAGGHAFQSLSAATGWGDHTCGLTTDGTVYCWGSNVLGELGDGSTNPSAVPVRVTGQ